MYLIQKGERRESDADHTVVGRDMKEVEEAEQQGSLQSAHQDRG